MAVRPTVVFLGDLTMVGTRPASELAAVNPAYDDAQADTQVWNIQTQTWQQLTPGVNSDTSTGVTDKWSVESRFRESIRAQFPTGTFWLIKHALDSTLIPISAKTSWSHLLTGSAFDVLKTQITNAAAAANGAGDTLRIDAFVIGISTDDFLSPTAQNTYGQAMISLVQALRGMAIPFTAMGSIRGSEATPAVILEPTYGKTGLDYTQQFFLALLRGTLAALEFDSLNVVSVLRTAKYSLAPDNKTFDAASMVGLGEAVGAYLFPATPTYSDQEAPLVLLVGDSITEGTGNNAELPTHLQSPLVGCDIWNYRTGRFESLSLSNNQIVLPAGIAHGVEMFLGENIRAHFGHAWMMKAASVGSRAVMWNPAEPRLFWPAMIHSWLLNLLDEIREDGKKPSLKLVSICLGTNDVLDSINLQLSVLSVQAAIEGIKNLMQVAGLNADDTIFVVGLPPETLTTNTARITELRDALSLLGDKHNIKLVDLNGATTIGDGIHLNSAGANLWADRIWSAYLSGETLSTTEPLFSPSKNLLKKNLRLSQVPDSNDALTVIDSAIQFVRTEFYRHLGQSKIESLLVMPYNATPKTSAENIRLLAVQTEVKWVRSQLLRNMPTLFMDSTARIQAWNEEAAFRETSFLQTERELKRLQTEIDEALEVLKTSALTASGQISMSTVSPDDSIAPGDTVFKVI